MAFFAFLQWTLTVLMKQTRQAERAFKQSILLRCLCLVENTGLSTTDEYILHSVDICGTAHGTPL